jgi:hypothetical protein
MWYRSRCHTIFVDNYDRTGALYVLARGGEGREGREGRGGRGGEGGEIAELQKYMVLS